MSESPRYGTNSKDTSKWINDILNDYTKMPRGVFNLSHRKVFDTPIFGIIPFDCFELLPNSEVYLKYDVQMLTKNPTIKRLLSSMHVELATYKINYNDTWEGWNNFITKGRSGKVSKSIPYVDFLLHSYDTENAKVSTSLPYNPIHYLNMAPSVFLREDGTNKFKFTPNTGVQEVPNLGLSGLTGIVSADQLQQSTAMRINALPLVLYNKICKKYQNQNLLQNNPHWYPENEAHDNILPYDCSGPISTSDYDNPTKPFDSAISIVYPSAEKNEDTGNYESYPWLNVLQLANRKGTYLNSGSPFPDLIRGDIPTLELINANINWDNVFVNQNDPTYDAFAILSVMHAGDGSLSFSKIGELGSTGRFNPDTVNNLLLKNNTSNIDPLRKPIFSDNGTSVYPSNYIKEAFSKATLSGIEFSMSQWRYLATMTVMKERMALCDGTYNSLIKAMFGYNPNWHGHEPTFCGGSTQPIVFSEVVNTADTGNSPLGETAGRAVTSSQNSLIHIKSDDFGCYMTVLIVVPDEYECQGVKKMWSRLENAEQYFPILNNLSPDATKNKEAYVTGTNTIDEDVFNYQERFAYYKSESNEISGLMALPISKVGDVGAYVQNRILDDTPEFNQEYIRGELTNNEKGIFASTDQAEFATVVSIQKRYIAPIPEDSRPSDMGISY